MLYLDIAAVLFTEKITWDQVELKAVPHQSSKYKIMLDATDCIPQHKITIYDIILFSFFVYTVLELSFKKVSIRPFVLVQLFLSRLQNQK